MNALEILALLCAAVALLLTACILAACVLSGRRGREMEERNF